MAKRSETKIRGLLPCERLFLDLVQLLEGLFREKPLQPLGRGSEMPWDAGSLEQAVRRHGRCRFDGASTGRTGGPKAVPCPLVIRNPRARSPCTGQHEQTTRYSAPSKTIHLQRSQPAIRIFGQCIRCAHERAFRKGVREKKRKREGARVFSTCLGHCLCTADDFTRVDNATANESPRALSRLSVACISATNT